MRQQIIVAVGAGLIAVVFLAAWVLSLPDTPAALLTAAPTATPPAAASPQPTAMPTEMPDRMPTATPVRPPTATPLPPTPPPAPTPTATMPPPTPTPAATPTPLPTPTVPPPTATPRPLFIDVDSPGYNATVRRPGTVTVVGWTRPNSVVQISNTIRGIGTVERSGLSDTDGRFAIDIALDQNLNVLQIIATHAATRDVTRVFWQVIYAPAPVELTVQITKPSSSGVFVYENPLPIAGKTTPGATVIINNAFEIEPDANGNWTARILLHQAGQHTITAVASLNGETADDMINVTYRPQ